MVDLIVKVILSDNAKFRNVLPQITEDKIKKANRCMDSKAKRFIFLSVDVSPTDGKV